MVREDVMRHSWVGKRKKGKMSGSEARCAAGKSEQEPAGGCRGATVTSKVESDSSETGPFPSCKPRHQRAGSAGLLGISTVTPGRICP